MTVQAFTIYPTKKYNRTPPPSTIALHGLDSLSSPIQIHNHRFFHPAKGAISDIVNNLKSSLAEALELYPPVAGTVLANESGELCVAVDAEHISGTPFLVDVKDTPYTGDSEDLSPRTDVILPPLSSTLAVKVTQVNDHYHWPVFFMQPLNSSHNFSVIISFLAEPLLWPRL